MTLSPLAWLEDKGCDSFWSGPKCQIARIKHYSFNFVSIFQFIWVIWSLRLKDQIWETRSDQSWLKLGSIESQVALWNTEFKAMSTILCCKDMFAIIWSVLEVQLRCLNRFLNSSKLSFKWVCIAFSFAFKAKQLVWRTWLVLGLIRWAMQFPPYGQTFFAWSQLSNKTSLNSIITGYAAHTSVLSWPQFAWGVRQFTGFNQNQTCEEPSRWEVLLHLHCLEGFVIPGSSSSLPCF